MLYVKINLHYKIEIIEIIFMSCKFAYLKISFYFCINNVFRMICEGEYDKYNLC